jgi:hypothetical protein
MRIHPSHVALLVLLHAVTPAIASPLPDVTAEHDARDPYAATALAVVGSLIPFAIASEGEDRFVLSGLLVGLVTPSLGQFYAGHYLTYGMAARAAGAALLVGFAETYQPCIGLGTCHEGTGWMAPIGLLAYLGGTIYDLGTAPAEARRWNQRHLSMSPTALPSTSGPAMGVAIGGAF